MGRQLGESEGASGYSREQDAGWRSRDLPPTPTQQYEQEKVLSWLNTHAKEINTTAMSDKGHTFLIMACISNNESLVYQLVNRGAALDIKAKGKTALHYACLLGHVQCAKHLLDAGADLSVRVDIDDSDYTECDGMTCLEIVIDKQITSRDPLRARLAEIERMLHNPSLSSKGFPPHPLSGGSATIGPLLGSTSASSRGAAMATSASPRRRSCVPVGPCAQSSPCACGANRARACLSTPQSQRPKTWDSDSRSSTGTIRRRGRQGGKMASSRTELPPRFGHQMQGPGCSKVTTYMCSPQHGRRFKPQS